MKNPPEKEIPKPQEIEFGAESAEAIKTTETFTKPQESSWEERLKNWVKDQQIEIGGKKYLTLEMEPHESLTDFIRTELKRAEERGYENGKNDENLD